jgi:hypothetical protein
MVSVAQPLLAVCLLRKRRITHTASPSRARDKEWLCYLLREDFRLAQKMSA